MSFSNVILPIAKQCRIKKTRPRERGGPQSLPILVVKVVEKRSCASREAMTRDKRVAETVRISAGSTWFMADKVKPTRCGSESSENSKSTLDGVI